jgi:ferredoxin
VHISLKNAWYKAPPSLANLQPLTNPGLHAAPEDFSSGPSTNKSEVQPDAGLADGDVVFGRSGVSVDWNRDTASLLDLAEQAGLAPEFSCRSGICNTCRCVIREGEVEYIEDPLDPPDAGEVLICSSRPKGRVVPDL